MRDQQPAVAHVVRLPANEIADAPKLGCDIVQRGGVAARKNNSVVIARACGPDAPRASGGVTHSWTTVVISGSRRCLDIGPPAPRSGTETHERHERPHDAGREGQDVGHLGTSGALSQEPPGPTSHDGDKTNADG